MPAMVRKLEPASVIRAPVLSPGRRNSAPSAQGRYTRAVPDERPAALALDATLRATVRRGGVHEGRLQVEACDLHRKERVGTAGTQILFVVDSSGSMAARRRMELVKGTVLRLLEDAYQQRDQVGVIAFRGVEARVLLSFTSNVEQAATALGELPTGGRTPLAHGLVLAADIIRRSSGEMPLLLVLLSDGKANVPLPGNTGDPWRQALEAAEQLATSGIPTLVLDSESGYVRSGRAREVATALAAEYLPLETFSADDLVLRLRAKTRTV
jgi:magnesium chelatase subunit D